jgi:hypothetical protein
MSNMHTSAVQNSAAGLRRRRRRKRRLKSKEENLKQENVKNTKYTYEGVFKSFRTGRLERELQMVEFSATRCSCIAIL